MGDRGELCSAGRMWWWELATVAAGRRDSNARHPDVLAARHEERASVRRRKGIGWGGRPLALLPTLLSSDVIDFGSFG